MSQRIVLTMVARLRADGPATADQLIAAVGYDPHDNLNDVERDAARMAQRDIRRHPFIREDTGGRLAYRP